MRPRIRSQPHTSTNRMSTPVAGRERRPEAAGALLRAAVRAASTGNVPMHGERRRPAGPEREAHARDLGRQQAPRIASACTRRAGDDADDWHQRPRRARRESRTRPRSESPPSTGRPAHPRRPRRSRPSASSAPRRERDAARPIHRPTARCRGDSDGRSPAPAARPRRARR